MNTFSAASRKELVGADPKLEQIAYVVLAIKDHSILKGHRNEIEQNAAYTSTPQRTKLKWPHGKHNGKPSKAIDVQTWPLPYAGVPRGEYRQEDYDQALREEQLYLLGLYVGVAAQMGITLRSGADWDRNGEIADNGFDDFFHVEIVRGRETLKLPKAA